MIFESEMELMRFTEGIRGKTFGEIDKLKLLEDGSTSSRIPFRKVVETGFYGFNLNDEANLNSIGIELKVVPFLRNNDGEAKAKERLVISQINYFDIVNEEFESSQLLRGNTKVLIIWYEYVHDKERTDMEIQYCQLYDMLQDQKVIKNDFEIIQNKVRNGEAHLLSESDTFYLAASTKVTKGKNMSHQPYSNISAKTRFFSLKVSYMTALLRSISSETSFKETVSPNGEGGINDHVTVRDLLGRSFLVKELGDFYIEYSEKNASPFYFGIFARWGMGKSSVVQMLMEHIKKQESKKNVYIICKVDCSLFDKKEKLWITILNQLLDTLSKTKEISDVNLFSFKKQFLFYNIWGWCKSRWLLFAWYGVLLIIIMYFNFTSSLPSKLIPTDYKESAAMITVITLIITMFKTGASIFKQNVLLGDNRNEDSSFIQSVKEYQQLITLMNKTKKRKNLKVLLILDELDRIHRELLPDIIEFIQLFKGIGMNDKQINQEEMKVKVNESVISFSFSFNHDLLFPIIGKNVSLDDQKLFLSSYHSYIEGEGKDAYINYYKLGKEYMDKYLDMTLYLEEELDYTELIDKLFVGIDGDKTYELNSSSSSTNEQGSEEEASSILSLNKNEKVEQENQSISSNITRENFPSFTKSEKKVIKDTIKNYTSGVEPRKVIRLNNALILLKKLNNKIDTDSNEYKEELKDFIINFLEVNNYDNDGTDSLSYTERIANHNNLKNDNLNKSKDESNESELDKPGYRSGKYLKFTEYFIHNKRQLKEGTRKV